MPCFSLASFFEIPWGFLFFLETCFHLLFDTRSGFAGSTALRLHGEMSKIELDTGKPTQTTLTSSLFSSFKETFDNARANLDAVKGI